MRQGVQAFQQIEAVGPYFQAQGPLPGGRQHGANIEVLYDAVLAQTMAAKLLEEGIYVIGFFFPVVAKGQARIRVQLSAAHEQEHLDKAIAAFTKIGKELEVLK